jgi:hypothetical protein
MQGGGGGTPAAQPIAADPTVLVELKHALARSIADPYIAFCLWVHLPHQCTQPL